MLKNSGGCTRKSTSDADFLRGIDGAMEIERAREEEAASDAGIANESLLQVLIRRDGLSVNDAKDLIEEARIRVVEDGEDPEEVLREEFGLEPDYILDLIGW